jgi:tripartite-type tricarboxylate transporter receptor subunit TctC
MKVFGRALLLIFLCTLEAAAQDYPSRTIRIVVAYPAGGATDTIARIIGHKMSESVGQPVVIENRPGASGLVGSQAAVSAAPDGYTLLLATPTVEAQPRFDPTRDALPIVMVARTAVVLSTRTDGPLSSVAALIAAAKQSPGKLAFGTTGAGSINQLAGEWFNADAGLKMLHVPYRGGVPAVNALLAGDIQATFLTASSVRALVDAGKLQVLAVAAKERMSIAPSWPTFAERGYDIQASIWFGLFAPPKTSADIVNRLDRLVKNIVADPEVQKRFNDLGVDVSTLSQDAFANMIRNETKMYLDVIKRAGIDFAN